MDVKSLTYSAYWTLVTDAAAFALAAEQSENEKKADWGRHARASILSSAVSLECAANRCLDSLALGGANTEEFDKLPFVAKFALYLGFVKNGSVLDRGCSEVQKIKELKVIRDAIVHPKRKTAQVEVSSDGEQILPFRTYQYLQIPRLHLLWNASHAGAARAAAVEFCNFFFGRLCGYDRDRTCGILMGNIETDPPTGPTKYAHRDEDLELAANKWGFDCSLISAAG